MLGRLTFLAALSFVLAPSAHAQPTNIEVYQQLARECLTDVPDTLQTFRLDAPSSMPYVRTALVNDWQEQERSLFLADTTARPLPELRYRVEEAVVAYERGDDQMERTVVLALRYTLTEPDGHLLREQSCRETYADTFPRHLHASLELDAFPETQGPLPEARGWRRYVEPAVLATAVGVGVYLFFNLRSSSDSDEANGTP